MDMNVFRDRLRFRRWELRLTQTELAQVVGVSRATLGLIEQGRRGVSLGEGWRLADALSVPLDWLSGRSDLLPEDTDPADASAWAQRGGHPL